MLNSIEQAISKIGGADEAYKLKLKQGIRDTMGYSNYMSKLNRNISGPADIGNVSGLSPAGINARISSKFGEQNQTTDALQSVTGSIDTAAGQLAAEQAAREKAAAAKAAADAKALKENLQYQPTNWAQSEVVNYMKSAPKNEDGSLKSREQLRTELQGQLTGEGTGMGVTAEQINQAIDSWIPSDYESKPSYYQAIALGATKGEAAQVQSYNDYNSGKMSSEAKSVLDIMNPSWAKAAEATNAQTSVVQQSQETIKDQNGERPKFTLDQLIQQNPNVPPADVTAVSKSNMTSSVVNSVHSQLYDQNKQQIDKVIQKGDYDQFMTTDEYKKLKTNLVQAYQAYGYKDQDVEQLIYNVTHGIQ